MSEYFLADDLSGALDAAAAFRAAGWRVTIVWSREAWPAASPGEIVGFSTETRNAAPAVAAERVRAVLGDAQARGGRLIYKKIDSTLRGQVAAELRAVMATLPDARVLFTPANPKVGRTVRRGVLCVRGVPVAETEFAHDPQCPVTESVIARLLGEVACDDRLRIADADTEADLEAAVAACATQPGPWFAVGSGALAKFVAACLATQVKQETGSEPVAARAPKGPLLFVCGSAHPGNRAQAAALARSVGVTLHEIPVAGSGVYAAATDHAAVIEQVVACLRDKGAVALLLEVTRRDPGAALETIAAVASTVIERAGVGRVFATGGETAFALCRALGVQALSVEQEIEPGLVLAETQGARRLWLAVKPGGFGDEETWLRGWRILSEGA